MSRRPPQRPPPGRAAPAHRPALPHRSRRALPRRPGLAAIRALLREASIGARVIRSELEERFQAFLINAGLALPRTNQRIEGYEADCVWPEQRLIVELDGHAFHSVTHAFEDDRARDRRLEAAGWHVIRVTWRQLQEEPELLEADLRQLLGQPASRTARPRATHSGAAPHPG